MRAMALATLGLSLASGFEQQCEVNASERAAWAAASTDALRALGYEVSAGAAEGARWQFAPLGTISNPGGTYGVVDLGSNASKFPGGDDYCRCLNGDVSVSAACARVWPRLIFASTRSSVCCSPSCTRVQPYRRSRRSSAASIVSGRVSSVSPMILHRATSFSACSSSSDRRGRFVRSQKVFAA